mmetsp:Transcript_18885/g.29542  ORF Transcript_18885/g.29542 Transcript_18885/m.29542 type:complete len:230 (+) Transcript_18885:490-1179(+)
MIDNLEQADPNETDDLGRTALIHAAAQGHDEVVKLLVEKGTDVAFSPSTDERSALHWAAFHGHQKCCDILQEAGCDVEEPDAKGLTPQALAMLGGASFLLAPSERSLTHNKLLNIEPEQFNPDFRIVPPPKKDRGLGSRDLSPENREDRANKAKEIASRTAAAVGEGGSSSKKAGAAGRAGKGASGEAGGSKSVKPGGRGPAGSLSQGGAGAEAKAVNSRTVSNPKKKK